ncbi:MAG: GntR family transcriptional regulator [Lachnospiraceae bacterium]|nr:GntR family transcriptional regulator [Lachnospiraceae bacterium]
MAKKKIEEPIESESKQIQVYNHIKEDILNGTFHPGTVLVERKLCDRYNVSRSPIRAALQMLTRDGLVSFSPNKGMIVPEITIEDIFEIYDLMELFQKYAVRRSIKRMNDVSLKALETILDKIRESLDKSDVPDAIKWDIKFHEFLVDFSGSSNLKHFYNQVSGQIGRFLSSTLDDTQLAERSYLEHKQIYECLVEGNLTGAEEAISKHYTNTKQYYIDRLLGEHLF